jgi:fatty acid desaturase
MASGHNPSTIRVKINEKWLQLSKDFVAKHPGGSVITQYKDADATHIFHAFHEGSQSAYKQLTFVEKNNAIANLKDDPTLKSTAKSKEVNVASYDFTIEQEKKIVKSFEVLRQRVHDEGLMEARPEFYIRKTTEVLSIMVLSFILQYFGWYLTSACFLALGWQQLGWLTHEFCHHQPLKNRRINDYWSLFLGNVTQGFSRNWWKLKHNTHHAATNIIDQDDDIDLAPLIAMVPDDLKRYKEPLEQLILKIVPYQHLYYTLLLPLLRFSWCSQSIVYVFGAPISKYKKDRADALGEQVGILLHWSWVLLQLYLLPSNWIRVLYFLISQLGGGFLVAHVVTYNHNSVDKYPENCRLLNNFAALHILTTRNMNPSPFIDWLWGGLNYQIEHHLFPTMPRPNLTRCSAFVKEFCKEVDLPYLVDDYWTGYAENLRQLENMAKVVESKKEKIGTL